MTNETDVVIVGAGSAGLSAAKELERLGLSFQLLEGSHRIGGRAYSEEIAPGVWFDLGCSYLHQAEVNPFVDIAKRLNRTIGIDRGDVFADEKIRFHHNGHQLDADETAACIDYYNRCDADIEAAADRGRDVAIADLIDLEHEYAPVFIEGASGGFATDLDCISSID